MKAADGRKKSLIEISIEERERLIKNLTEELPILRAKIGLSQTEISTIVGISRQTYSAIETKKRNMSWGTYFSLMLFFEHNKRTRPILMSIGAFPEELEQMLNINKRDGE